MPSVAIFTMQKDETFHLPQWISYYSRHFNPEDMYVVDHDSHEPTVRQSLAEFDGNVHPVINEIVFNHDWLLEVVHGKQRELLEHYDYVLYTDTDEFIVPANGALRDFLTTLDRPGYRCVGYEVVQGQMYHSDMYDKTLLSDHPLTWDYGYHHSTPRHERAGDLFLYHLHRISFSEAWAKNQRWRQHPWDPNAVANGFSTQNQIAGVEEFRQWFHDTLGNPLEPWHDRMTDQMADLDLPALID